MRFPAFVGGSAPTQSLTLDGQKTVNLYIERAQANGGQNDAALLPTPGFMPWTPVSNVADVGARAFLYVSGRLFAVMGAGVYEFDINGTPTKRGTVATDGNPAQIVGNGTVGGQLAIASGGNLYCYVLATNVLTQVLSGDATMVAYAGGFGLAFNLLTGHVRLSALNDFTSWSAGTFFQRSLFPDPWQAMFVDANNLVWLPGTESFEVWYDTGVGTQPFAPLSGLVGRYGIAAPFAFAASGAGNFWLARNSEGGGEFVVTRGSAPKPISTYAVNTAIAGYLRTAKIDDAEVLIYQQEGHTFSTIAFPSAPATWAVDVETQSWAERGKWNVNAGRFDLWSPRCHVYAFGKHLVGDRTSGVVSQMDTAIATETDGTGIRRMRRAPHLNTEHQRVPIDCFELLMDVGLGTATGQGSDPQAMLRVSPDGGRTFGNELRCGIGKIGQYRKRVVWNRLGAAPDAVFEVTYTDPTPLRIVDAYVNNREGSQSQAA